MNGVRHWFRSGDPWVWLTAGGVSVSLLLVLGVLALIAVRGLGYFWPHAVIEAEYRSPKGERLRLIGQLHDREWVSAKRLREAGLPVEGTGRRLRHLVKIGGRDLFGRDFVWVLDEGLEGLRTPPGLAVIERWEWGNVYGYVRAVLEDGRVVAEGEAAWPEFLRRFERVRTLRERARGIEKDEIGAVNYRLERLRLRERRLELEGRADDAAAREAIAREREALQAEYARLREELTRLRRALARDSYRLELMDGRVVELPLAKVAWPYRPNDMTLAQKLGHYLAKLWTFVSEDPREANTEGGIFPAIFGTVLMVLVMSVFVTPLGVVAAVYLREYARQGTLTRLIRISVNNLAGVPSIVYGLFGLGFFVYLVGGTIDRLFFPEALPAPTFGTGGVLWASLTLALLTLPVVIVSAEEGLARIPRAIREGSLALGATKAETLWRVVIPMASPAIMTGLILAVARAAGEVAPLMLVGVVKLAPAMPVDGNWPYLHLERKFMHLGFHIYDVGFQSPNVEAARPLVYATALLLVLVIVALNLTAILIRNRLRERYRAVSD